MLFVSLLDDGCCVLFVRDDLCFVLCCCVVVCCVVVRCSWLAVDCCVSSVVCWKCVVLSKMLYVVCCLMFAVGCRFRLLCVV